MQLSIASWTPGFAAASRSSPQQHCLATSFSTLALSKTGAHGAASAPGEAYAGTSSTDDAGAGPHRSFTLAIGATPAPPGAPTANWAAHSPAGASRRRRASHVPHIPVQAVAPGASTRTMNGDNDTVIGPSRVVLI